MSENIPSEGTGAGRGTATARAKAQQNRLPGPAEREQRVAELRQQVQEGTYRVDAAKLSAALLEKTLEK